MRNGQSVSGIEISRTGDRIAFLGNSGGASLNPALAFDVVVGQGFTVGGTFQYASVSAEETVRQGAVSASEFKEKLGKGSAFGAGVRAGYAYMFNEFLGIWPRVGVRYDTGTDTSYSYSGTTETEYVSDINIVSVVPDINLVVAPTAHFAFLIGAAAQFGVSGSWTDKSAGTTVRESDFTASGVGLAAGLMGYL